MKNLLIIIGLLLLLGVAFYFTQKTITGGSFNMVRLSKPAKAVIKKHTFSLLVAKTENEKEIGLSGKKSLPKDSGMVFPYDPKDTPTFWMKGMQFPIDIVFVSDGKIVTLFKNAQAPFVTNENLQLYRPVQPIDNVIEINAGLSDQYGFKEGDTASITL